MTDRLASPAFRVLGPRARLLGVVDDDSLQSVNTTPLPNGSVCWVQDQVAVYALHRDSTAAPSGTLIVAPAAGPGRWFVLGLGAAVGFAVPDIATLASIPLPTDGAQIRVESVRSDWTFELGSTIAVDGISVVSDPDNTGRWLRSLAPDLSWAYQGAWFVDAVGGDDENVGSTALTAVSSFAEIARRLNGQTLHQVTDIQLLSDLDEQLRLNVVLDANPVGSAYRLLVRSTIVAWTTILAGSFTGVVLLSRTAPGGGNATQITDAALTTDPSTFIGKRIRITSVGVNFNATAWVIKRLSATSFATTPFVLDFDPLTVPLGVLTAATPVVNDTYVIEDVPGVKGVNLNARRVDLRFSGISLNIVSVVDSIDVQKGETSLAAYQEGAFASSILSNTFTAVPFTSRSGFFSYSVKGTRASYQSCRMRVPAGETMILDGFIASFGGVISSDVATPTFLSLTETGMGSDFTSIGVTLLGGLGLPQGCGIFDCPTDGVRMVGGYNNPGAASTYGNGNAGYGMKIIATTRASWQQAANRNTILGALGAISFAGQVFQDWTQFPLSDPFNLCAGVDSQQVTSISSRYTTGIVANIGSTALFTSVPVKGLYRIQVYLAVVTAGNAPDTVTMNLTYTDDSKAETVAVFSAVSVGAKGFFQANRLVETNGVANVNFTFTYTKTGAPSCNLRLIITELQSAGT